MVARATTTAALPHAVGPVPSPSDGGPISLTKTTAPPSRAQQEAEYKSDQRACGPGTYVLDDIHQSERERKLRVGLASLNAVAAQLSHLRLAPLTGDRFGSSEGCVENSRSNIMFFSSFF